MSERCPGCGRCLNPPLGAEITVQDLVERVLAPLLGAPTIGMRKQQFDLTEFMIGVRPHANAAGEER